jgi:hypothetical protein
MSEMTASVVVARTTGMSIIVIELRSNGSFKHQMLHVIAPSQLGTIVLLTVVLRGVKLPRLNKCLTTRQSLT